MLKPLLSAEIGGFKGGQASNWFIKTPKFQKLAQISGKNFKFLFQDPAVDPSIRYDCFYTIFLAREAQPRLHERRISVLTRLCSIALQLEVFPIFDDLATYWLKNPADPSISLVTERLINDFVKPPPAYSIFMGLLPLREKALEFSCIFLSHGINADVYGPQIVTIVGQWLTEDLTDTLEFFGEHPALAKRFGETTLPLLVQWDVDQENSSEETDRFHCAITGLIVFWPQKKNPLSLDVFINLISTADSLQPRQITRLLANSTNAINTGMFPTQRFIETFANAATPKVLRQSPFAELIEKSFENKFHF
uniref:Uncharacterized protein n=1 Tax=Bursaphelenchus xylophilus TaxID=6326 RepID=A0A1I7RYL8_BURXY